ncbi:zona pellucida sperm-binding protein 3-like [Sphaerodactylus townsendi]|uniref:zona pellucida sperm-binding protein 3-like n=1 Tax=Sphaerodactylus townsendi TaxID=933632 RepID=UPI00202708BB|nr:zona pellucida sperm-binding protein 3-like [Sphaerodactylus townsendi]
MPTIHRKSLSESLPSFVQPVAVQCQETQMVVVVYRDLFGTGQLIQADDFSLGPQGCYHTSTGASDKLVVFEVGLHACSSKVQTTSDSLIYHTSLYYNPSFASNSITVGNSPIVIPIECHYPRKENVSSRAIKPTRIPFNSTVSAGDKLLFSLRLMNDNWSAERTSTGYRLGDILHIQADVYGGNHVPLRLFVDSCVATQEPGKDSTPKYAIIDFHGCLVDGRIYGASSAFRMPRSQQETLQFTVEAFRFAGDTKNTIYVTCHLKVTAADEEPDLLNKACSFNNQRNSWLPVEGSKDICSCCEMGNCPSPRGWSNAVNPSNSASTREKKLMFSRPEEMVDDLVVGPLSIFDVDQEHQKDQMEAKGIPTVIEVEADSAIGPQFILQTDKELSELLVSETVTSNDMMLDETYENGFMDAKMSTGTDESSGDLTILGKGTKMPLQGRTSEKQSFQENFMAIAAGTLMHVLLRYIF